ncbi:hypothetical protein [Candidatus Formimonas warabiya]|uniref:Uncharacterized protein n=1 Tax=Formimonas warabiya TaxID=1761012 RepID=A0A3G1KZX0_FORW1|nr:hypothetical protein [Candidatus Formimonas warabiya]ATW27957.1 hypothetical protein DCMF_27235 [Candidatus Formimonas warabiya]
MGIDEVCKDHSGFCSDIRALDKKIEENARENRESHAEMWKTINDLRNRLPTWTTLFISFLTLCLGWALSEAFK